ncbi:hydroxymethylglutaryl-CoA synthase family protein [Halorubrum sp. JWXQ-INN 858]|uniref:hydroxymethylglutaryl-CoA synthase family protein n=1 Tax=Halorubrum sp. JWXQ-INN 858 TaxID=2690782 RepID=UPI00190F77F8|nr:hydroxymethylglutaryl-CoA synthase family protein [Halorubrum sp. JWXQ-INN 858]
MTGTDVAEKNAIAGVGVYTPRYRVDAETFIEAWGGFEARGVAAKSVAAGDEDTVTMAAEAAERALADADVDPESVTALRFATTTPTVEEFDVGATLAAILGLPTSVAVSVDTQSTGAGTRALRAGFDDEGTTLVVASDAPFAAPDDAVDHAAGAGAVAFLLTAEGTVGLREATTYTEEFPGTRFRGHGSATVERYEATAYERHAFSGPIAAAVGSLDDPETAVALTAPDGSLPHRAARALDFDADVYHAADRFGDLGAASALFGLVTAWDDGVDAVTLVGYGDGATVDALVLDGRLDASLDRETEAIGYAEYLRKRGHVVTDDGGVN